MSQMSTPVTHVPVVAGPAYVEQLQRLPSKFTAILTAELENRFNRCAVAVHAGGGKIGYLPPDVSPHYFQAAMKGVECQGRRAPVSAHENTGTDVLLDLSEVACEP
jgi:hypothetical protein